MCRGYVEFTAIEEQHCIDFHEYFACELTRLGALEADGLVEIDDHAILVTDRGRFLVRNAAMVFDAYLKPQRKQEYSKIPHSQLT